MILLSSSKKIDQHGFDPSEKVVGVHPKERELKVEARIFSLLTLEKRLYVVVTEALLSENLLRYFPEITMTFNDTSLKSRIHQLTKPSESSRAARKKVVTNIDFSKWNSWMRKEETSPLFTDLDNLFGFSRVFSRTHELFNFSSIYLADNTVSPEISENGDDLRESDNVWKRHLGGLEGLRQKGWTIWTVVILKRVAKSFGIQCQIVGQGDNQVLISSYPGH